MQAGLAPRGGVLVQHTFATGLIEPFGGDSKRRLSPLQIAFLDGGQHVFAVSFQFGLDGAVSRSANFTLTESFSSTSNIGHRSFFLANGILGGRQTF